MTGPRGGSAPPDERAAIKRRIWEVVEVAAGDDRLSRIFDICIISLIFLNVIAVVLETVPEVRAQYEDQLYLFEVFSSLVFTAEYVLRLWTCTTDPRYQGAILGRLRYARTPMAIVDLMAVLPFYLPMFTNVDLRFLRVLRMFRLFRLIRYSESLSLLDDVLVEKKEQLAIAVFTMLSLLVLAASVMYYVEHDAQPDKFSSIPASMWWAVATLTTVGYGDVYPVTGLGRFLGAVIACLGFGMFALPAGILSSGLTEAHQAAARKSAPCCPNCGCPLEGIAKDE